MIMNRSAIKTKRSGTVLAAVLIGLSIATLMLTAMAKSAHLAQQHLRLHVWQHQTEWLCEAGFARAHHAILGDDSYAGEVWLIGSEHLSGDFDASVEIRIEHDHIIVSTKYPSQHPSGLLRTETFARVAQFHAE